MPDGLGCDNFDRRFRRVLGDICQRCCFLVPPFPRHVFVPLSSSCGGFQVRAFFFLTLTTPSSVLRDLLPFKSFYGPSYILQGILALAIIYLLFCPGQLSLIVLEDFIVVLHCLLIQPIVENVSPSEFCFRVCLKNSVPRSILLFSRTTTSRMVVSSISSSDCSLSVKWGVFPRYPEDV